MLVTEKIADDEFQVVKDDVLHITPSDKINYSKVYLSESKLSWITIEWLSEELLDYATENYKQLFELHPVQRGKIVMYDNEECDSPRWHKSYLHQPLRTGDPKKTYMYSGLEQPKDLALPPLFDRFTCFMNEKTGEYKYNQVIVNWYANGKDYIAQHSDCQIGMLPDAGIAIVTLCQNVRFPRVLKITPKNLKNGKPDSLYTHIKIELKHGCIITMYGKTQTNFKHGVPKDINNTTSRISLTFRKFT